MSQIPNNPNPEITPGYTPGTTPEPTPIATADTIPVEPAPSTEAPEQSAEVEPAPETAAPTPALSTQAPASKPLTPRRLALLNQKGGVGKTTTTANLGAALANLGHSVLLIDLDPQAHLTLHLGVDPENLERSIYDLLVDDAVAAAEVVQNVEPNLDVIPAEVNLAGAETELAPKMATGSAQRILRNKLDVYAAAHPYDFIIIDCPPSLGLLTINALTTANEVIVPMQAHFLSLQGLSKLLETVSLINQSFNPDLTVAGIVLCMHESQTILSKEVVSDLKAFLEQSRDQQVPWQNALLYDPPIRRNIKLAECPSFGQTVFTYAKDCHGATDYTNLAKSVVNQ